MGKCFYVDFKYDNKETSTTLKFHTIRGKYLMFFQLGRNTSKEKRTLNILSLIQRVVKLRTAKNFHFVLQEGTDPKIPVWSIVNKS